MIKRINEIKTIEFNNQQRKDDRERILDRNN